MGIGAPKDLSECRRFFLEPAHSKQRMYEALRAYFVDELPSAEVAHAFNYSPGSFQVLCHHFRRDADPDFFVSTRPGPRSQPKKSAARDLIVRLRKQNHSVYEISDALKEQQCPLSPTAVREVLKQEGFAPLPRRLDDERPQGPRPTIEARCRRSPDVSVSTYVYHRLWWSLPVRSRFGPSASGFVGPSRAFAWIEDDSRRPRLARLPGSEAVVN